jgi:hypothetical protein
MSEEEDLIYKRDLKLLLEKSTDLLSSKNLCIIPEIYIYSIDDEIHKKNADNLLLSLVKNISGKKDLFLEFSVHNFSLEVLIPFLDKFENEEVILTNNISFIKKIETIKKYAPYSKISLIINQNIFNNLPENEQDYINKTTQLKFV